MIKTDGLFFCVYPCQYEVVHRSGARNMDANPLSREATTKLVDGIRQTVH